MSSVSSLGISSFVIPPAPPWHLVYQSRSGPPSQPWLEPDVTDFLTGMKGSGFRVQEEQKANPLNPEPRTLNPSSVVLVPIGFISDHMEVVYDLDTEARATCDRLGIRMVRAATVGTHPRFVRMIRELVVERMSDAPNRLALGALGPSHDVCPDDCCLYSPHRPASKP
jgi:ferrochelatase